MKKSQIKSKSRGFVNKRTKFKPKSNVKSTVYPAKAAQLRSPKKTRVSRVDGDERNWVLKIIKKLQTATGGPSRKKLLHESQKKRSKNESFPPGEDKIRVIVNEFLKRRIITEAEIYDGKSVNSGLVLNISNTKLTPNFLGSEPYNVENILADLWEINKNEYRFEKEDFFKLVILKKQLISLPGKLLINPRGNEQMSSAELWALIPYIEMKLKKLEEIKNDQKTFSKFLKDTKKEDENRVKRFGSYFEKIEKVASKIIESPHNYNKPISIAKKDKKIKSLYDEIDEYFGFLSN